MKYPDIVLVLGFCVLLAPQVSGDPGYGLDWNPDRIAWHDYRTGLERARSTGKPLLVVLFAPWCAVCHEYEGVFQDERVLSLTHNWIMSRIDVSVNEELSQAFAEDGIYTPRVYMVAPDGSRRDIHSDHPQFKHFFAPDPKIFIQLLGRSDQLRTETSL